MRLFRIKIRPLTAFGSPILGETLFGQICWAIAETKGTERLVQLLDGYTDNRPFCVVSDAFPSGYVPLPSLPGYFWAESDGIADRKELKKRKWIRIDQLKNKPRSWRNQARTEKELFEELGLNDRKVYPKTTDDLRKKSISASQTVVRNTIHRVIQSTKDEQFAPYTVETFWYRSDLLLDIYAAIDEQRFSEQELKEILGYVGMVGYGRDASVGMGKFEVDGEPEKERFTPSRTRLTLASSDLSNQPEIVSKYTYYKVRTHFGRHGVQAGLNGNPFKFPVVLASTAAVVTFSKSQKAPYMGRGLTELSRTMTPTYHQGYCPVLSLPDVQVEGS